MRIKIICFAGCAPFIKEGSLFPAELNISLIWGFFCGSWIIVYILREPICNTNLDCSFNTVILQIAICLLMSNELQGKVVEEEEGVPMASADVVGAWVSSCDSGSSWRSLSTLSASISSFLTSIWNYNCARWFCAFSCVSIWRWFRCTFSWASSLEPVLTDERGLYWRSVNWVFIHSPTSTSYPWAASALWDSPWCLKLATATQRVPSSSTVDS